MKACFLALLGFSSLSILLMSPIDPGRSIPAGTETASTVPLFNLWTLIWNSECLFAGRSYWDAPIYFPMESTFALSETQPPLLLVAPVALLISPIFAYNLFVFANLTLNGILSWRLCLHLTNSGGLSAAVCGMFMQLLPFVSVQLGVLQLIAVWPFLLVLEFSCEVAATASMRSAAKLGLSLGTTYLFCNNYGLMAAVVLTLIGVPMMLIRFRVVTSLTSIAVTGLCFAAVGSPLILKQLSMLTATQYDRDSATVAGLSAQAADYFVNPWEDRPQIPWLYSSRARPLWGLSCGLANLLLAVGGLVIGLRSSRLRLWTVLLIALLVVSFLLSVLPGVPSGGMWLYGQLSRCVPGLSKIRSVYRFAMFVHVAIVLLGAVLVCTAESWIRDGSWRTMTRMRKAVVAGTGILIVLSVVEIYPDRTYVCFVPWRSSPSFCVWLRENSRPDDVLACFPFPMGRETKDFQNEVAWMLAGHIHKRRIVNGYSGYFPRQYTEVKDASQFLPDEKLLSKMKELGVGYLLIHEGWYRSAGKRVPDLRNSPGLELMYFDADQSVRIFRVR